MSFRRLLGVLLVLFLLVAVIASLLRALPLIVMVVGVVLLMRRQSSRHEKATALTANVPRQGRAKSADTVRTVPDVFPQEREGSIPRGRFLVPYPPDAVHDAIQNSLATIGAEVRWDRRNPRLAEGTVTEGGFLGATRYINVTFGSLPKGGCWVAVASDSEEMQAQFQRALDELVGPTRNLVDGYEAVWCRRFNEAMARQGDSTRVYPDCWICLRCGAVCIGGVFCGRCGTRIEAAR